MWYLFDFEICVDLLLFDIVDIIVRYIFEEFSFSWFKFEVGLNIVLYRGGDL